MTDRKTTRKSRSKPVAPLSTMQFMVHDLTDRRIFSNIKRRIKGQCPMAHRQVIIPHVEHDDDE